MMDVSLLFDIGANDGRCTIPADKHEYFFEDFDSEYVQLIVSDRVPNCLLESMGKLGWYSYTISSKNMDKDFGTN